VLAFAITLPFVRDRREAASRIDDARAHALAAIPDALLEVAVNLQPQPTSCPDREALRASLAAALLDEALARTLADRALADRLVWPVRDALARALATLEAQLDDEAAAWFSWDEGDRDPDLREALARARATRCLGAAPLRPARIERSIGRAWDAMEPPQSRRAARMIDLAQDAPPPVRAVILGLLARRGVDVRGVLSADAALSADERVAILAGRPRRSERLAWEQDPERQLSARLADWSRYASSPRVLFLRCAHAVGPDRWRAVLAAADRWPLAPEVREERSRWLDRAPVLVRAEPIGPGRHACARCGSPEVRALDRAPLVGGEEPPSSGEVEFMCPECSQRYHSAWDRDTAGDPAPEAWVLAE
jgi:hypothetical protein